MRRLLAVLVLAFGLVWIAPAGAITGGARDGENHPYVAFVRNTQFACTAAAISPTVLVTAAHCFTFPEDDVWVTFNTNRRSVPFPAGFLTGTWFADPDFCQGLGTCPNGLVGFDSHDVAVIVLDEPVTLPRYASLPSLGQVDTLPNGSGVDSVGYGVESFVVGGGKPTAATTSGFRNIAPANIVPGNGAISDEFLKLSANHSQGKGGTCFGDSGGPNLLAGTDTILSINSFVTNGRCNGVTYSNRIDLGYALDFINGFLGA